MSWSAIPGLKSSGPSCEQVRGVVRWSAEHYGGAASIDLNRAVFISRVGEVILEKLDPRRILFTQEEAEQLKAINAKAWRELVGNGQCAAYEKWITDHFTAARLRLFAILSRIDIAKVTPKQHEAFGAFALSESDLRQRLRLYVGSILVETTPEILKAYRSNKKVYVEDNLQQVIGEESDPLARSPRLLVAKAALGAMDTYSTYLSDAEFIDFHEDLAAGTTGVGVRLRKVPTGLLVEGLVEGAPAGKSGLIRVGDIITAVDGTSVVELPFGESRKFFRGTPNSEVTLTLTRANSTPARVALRRAPFAFEDGKVQLSRGKKDHSVMVVDIPSFYSDDLPKGSSSALDLRRALVGELVKKTRPQALVLDVRGNPGGYLEEAVQMAGLFVGRRPIVSVVEKHGKKTLRDFGASQIFSGPIVILQNEESASAAEILTGALRDYERAVVVGTSVSYGKGSVQRLYDLDGADALNLGLPGVVKLTSSLFFTPLGHSPANGGIRSDISLRQAHSKALRQPVTDLTPFVDAAQLAQIQKKRTKMDGVRADLKQRSESRRSASEITTTAELDEAVQVASDWLAFERTESNGTRYQTRRDVIGY